MNKLRERFRQRLLGQLSQEKTEVDINNAVDVCKDFSVSFSLFCTDYNYERLSDRWYKRSHFQNFPDYYTTEELYNEFLEIYDKP